MKNKELLDELKNINEKARKDKNDTINIKMEMTIQLNSTKNDVLYDELKRYAEAIKIARSVRLNNE